MNQGQGNVHFNVPNNFSPAHISQQSQQAGMMHLPQHSPMGQQQQNIPQQLMQQPQPQLMQQQLTAQQQQLQQHQQGQEMLLPQSQMMQQAQPQLMQQQLMAQQQQLQQQQLQQQQQGFQHSPAPQMQQQQQQRYLQQHQQQQGNIFQHPQQHSPAQGNTQQGNTATAMQQQPFLQQQQHQQMHHQQQQPPQQQQPQQQPQKDFNPASLCRIGQETVQELVSRVQECLQHLKNLQPPNGSAQSTSLAADKKNKLDDQLKMVKVLFKRLRIIYNKCNENSQELDSYPLDSMIPTQSNLVDWQYADKTKSEQYLAAVEEKKELYEQIAVKNRHLQDIMEYMRSIIWEINTMLMMRRP